MWLLQQLVPLQQLVQAREIDVLHVKGRGEAEEERETEPQITIQIRVQIEIERTRDVFVHKITHARMHWEP